MGGESGLSEREGGREEHFRVFFDGCWMVGCWMVGCWWLGVGWLRLTERDTDR